MSEHTPGPWRLRELIDSTLAVYGSGEYDIVFPKRNAKSDADARLILSSPELLKELEIFVRLYDAGAHFDELTLQKIANDMRAAIAKAKGESKPLVTSGGKGEYERSET